MPALKTLPISVLAAVVFIPPDHYSQWKKLWPSAHFYHAGAHSSLITPFRWYKLGLSHSVSLMDGRGQYETHWSISWISFCVSRLCDSVGASLLLQACSALIKKFAAPFHSAVCGSNILIYTMQIIKFVCLVLLCLLTLFIWIYFDFMAVELAKMCNGWGLLSLFPR